MNISEWRALLRSLRKRFPVSGTVRVVRRPLRKDCGRTVFNGCHGYRVTIDSIQPWQGQVDTLLHEWAHVRAIEQAYAHDGPWGSLFAEIYDAWTKDFQQ